MCIGLAYFKKLFKINDDAQVLALGSGVVTKDESGAVMSRTVEIEFRVSFLFVYYYDNVNFSTTRKHDPRNELNPRRVS